MIHTARFRLFNGPLNGSTNISSTDIQPPQDQRSYTHLVLVHVMQTECHLNEIVKNLAFSKEIATRPLDLRSQVSAITVLHADAQRLPVLTQERIHVPDDIWMVQPSQQIHLHLCRLSLLLRDVLDLDDLHTHQSASHLVTHQVHFSKGALSLLCS